MEHLQTTEINIKDHENVSLLHMLDRGIDDMESGRTLPLDVAFSKISELRSRRREERV